MALNAKQSHFLFFAHFIFNFKKNKMRLNRVKIEFKHILFYRKIKQFENQKFSKFKKSKLKFAYFDNFL